MACVRGTGASCDCRDELVAILSRLSLDELRQLDRGTASAVLDSITEACERKTRDRVPKYVMACPQR